MNRKGLHLVALVVILGMVLGGCAQPTPGVVEVEKIVVETVEVEVEKEVEIEKIVEVEKEVEVVVTATPEPAADLEAQIVPLGWLNNDEFVALQAAQANGYYAEEGFDVTLVSGGGSTGFDPIIAVGGFDSGVRFGVPASLVLALHGYGEGADVLAVATLMQSTPSGFLTLITEDRRATGPCDFKDRIVSMQTEAMWFVDALGAVCPPEQGGPLVPGEDFTVIPAGWTPDCLDAGQCDYYCAWATNQPFKYAEMGMVEGEDYEMFLTGDFLPFRYADVIITTRAYAEENPEAVAAFVRASMRGLQYAIENEEEAIDISASVAGVSREHAAWRIPVQNRLSQSEDTETYGLGYMDLEKVQEMIDFLYEYGQISRTFDASEVVDNSFLPGPDL